MELRRHRLGFLEVYPKPTPQELRLHYNERYFGAGRGQYTASYSDEELRNKQIQSQEALSFAPGGGRLLDIGCGEGFVLEAFQRWGWDVQGADFTLDGIRHFFPHLADRVMEGDLFATIKNLAARGDKFDLVSCLNVLEHVLDPVELLVGIKPLLRPKGVLRLIVPNDNSPVQQEIVRRNLAKPDFWLCPPDHLNYFQPDSFRALLREAGLQEIALLADFPIDFFLFHPESNYQRDPARGKASHLARVAIENLIAKTSIEPLIEFRRGCAQAGVGRNLIAYCRLGEST